MARSPAPAPKRKPATRKKQAPTADWSVHDYVRAKVAKDMENVYRAFGHEPPPPDPRFVDVLAGPQGGTGMSLMGRDALGREWDSFATRM